MLPENTKPPIFSILTGVLAGATFSFLAGSLEPADYVIEFLSFVLVEIPYVALAAVIIKKYGLANGLLYLAAGSLVSIFFFIPSISLTTLVFIKTALMGMLIGDPGPFSRSYPMRLTAVVLPAFILALAIGMPMIYQDVPRETLDVIREDTLAMYESFMSHDDAVNTVDNAMDLFKGFFKASVGIMTLGSFALAWFSFLFTGWLLGKMGEEAEYLPSFARFKTPFWLVWVLIISLGLMLFEYKPLHPIAVNVLLIMVGLYGIQGLAVIVYHMNRMDLGVLPRIIFWVLFFVTLTFSGVIIVFAGVFDNWFNLRRTPTKPPGGNEKNHSSSHE